MKNDQLAVLRHMRSEGRITKKEYEELTRGSRAPADVPAETDDVHDAADIDDAIEADGRHAAVDTEARPTEDDELEADHPSVEISLRKDLTAGYLGGLAVAALGLILVSSLGMLSWFATISAILLLATTLIRGWRKVTIAGAVAVALIMLVGFVLSAAGSAEPQQPTAVTLAAPQDPYPAIPGSLGIYMDQLTELWNTVDSPPQIVKGLTRYNETGEYDTFIYRFGEWGRVAGAYDPDNDALYALLVTGQFSAEATDQLYLHLCYVLAPFSQECIDSYFEKGLEGGILEDFADTAHDAEWALGDHTWRLEIDQNVMTIRVYGEDAA